ncbi:DUF5753 domain-containing protein [Nocardia sp. NPDC003963]
MESATAAPHSPEIVDWDDYTLPELQDRTHSLEAGAEDIRGYDPDLLPGQLQTRAYAAAVLRVCQQLSGRPIDYTELEEAVAARMARQSDWRAGSGYARFVIAEQALYTTVGNPAVMVAQLETLLEILELDGGLVLSVVPRDAPLVAPATNFTFYDETTVTVETMTCQITVTDIQGGAGYEAAFDRLAAHAVTGDAAAALIETALAHHRRAVTGDE